MAAKAASMVIPRNMGLPVLQNAEIEAKDGRAYLRVSDLERILVMDLFATVEEAGKVLIPNRRLWHFAAHEKGPVVIESKGRSLSLGDVDGQVKVNMYLGPPDDALPNTMCGETQYEVGDEFIMNLARAWPFTADEDVRPVLTAVLVESDGQGKVSFASADGFRLFMSSMKLTLPAGKWLIPRKTCMLLEKIMRKKESVRVGFDNAKMWFDGAPDVRVVSQLIQGSYPQYPQLIPAAKPEWTFTVSGPVLQSRVQQFKDHIVRLSKTEDGFLKVAMTEDEDKFEAKIPAVMTGDGKIAVDSRYVADLAGLFAELTMEVISPSSPVKVYGDLEGVLVVNMPMFVQW
jgi:DNA polymerase III sliding clamp (beta) subunit (PCNA family)